MCLVLWTVVGPVHGQKSSDPELPAVPPDPELESFFDAKSRVLTDRLRGVVEGSIRKLDRGSSDARREARIRLLALNQAARPLVEAAVNGENRPRAVGALLTLSFMRGEDPAPLILTLVERSDAEEVRATAALVLGRLGARKAAPTLAQLAAENRHSLARVAAMLALGRMRAVGERDAVLQIIERDEFDRLTAAALMTVGRLGGEGTELLRDRLAASNEMVRRGAAIGLGFAGIPEAARWLSRLLQDPEEPVRRAAAAALSSYADEDWIRSLLREEFQRGKGGGFLAACLRSGHRVDTEGNLEFLLLGFRSREAEVRAAAAALASQHESEATRSALVRALGDDDPRVRGTAALSLAWRGDREAVKAVGEVVNRSAPEATRLDATLSLALLAPDPARAVALAEKEIGGRISFQERQVGSVLRQSHDSRTHLREWVERRLVSRGATAPQGLTLEANLLLLELLDLSHLNERTVGRGAAVVAREAPPHLLDLRIWLEDYPYFDRMSG